MPKPTSILVTTPSSTQDDSAPLKALEDESFENNVSSPRSCSANNIYPNPGSRIQDRRRSISIGANSLTLSLKKQFCSCRKCSLFDDCDPKETKTVMKYLRFRKVTTLEKVKFFEIEQGVPEIWLETILLVSETKKRKKYHCAP